MSCDIVLYFVLPLLVQGIIAFLLIKRGWGRKYPWFLTYNLSAVGLGILRMIELNHASAYFYVFWSTSAVFSVLGLASVQEGFRSIFHAFNRMPWFRTLLPSTAVVLFAAGVLHGVHHWSWKARLATEIVTQLQIAISLVQLGVLGVFFATVRFFRMRWKQFELGTAFGFGIMAAVSLLALVVRSEIGTRLDAVVGYSTAWAYIGAVLVWLVYFLRKEPPESVEAPALNQEEMLDEIRRYNRAVRGLLNR